MSTQPLKEDSLLPKNEKSLPQWKTTLITTTLSLGILRFGTFTLKSGRVSPYFFNCGLLSQNPIVGSISSAYANLLHTHSLTNPSFEIDVLFGPAYKGIPLCATVCLQLGVLDPQRWGKLGYSFNRKEVKTHGEGGNIIGQTLRGKRVVVVDDVITAGTAVREAVEVIEREGGVLVGVIVAVDRQERVGESGRSAVGEVRSSLGVPVWAVITLIDIVEVMRQLGREEEVQAMVEYHGKYGARD
ncbi:orotate phosphoribosyltransferase [Piedraia hortae CBS 480.64]|uniref:Orotate phosphoribosyltransferase n=1 Tax=Piedraia hortae CBS 480.64 TaxID=1314780 RepID=A0A6A7C5Y8_9PEZI|nr:orotate phosphoribosyltransferase [Piedraia hortae CBS 480.64]